MPFSPGRCCDVEYPVVDVHGININSCASAISLLIRKPDQEWVSC